MNRIFLSIILLLIISSSMYAGDKSVEKRKIISYVDTSLDASQKYVLRVDGKPFYMTNVQVRMDLMRHSQKWPAETREAIIAAVAADGFNTVSIPIHWYEVEPEKDKFDWTILDEYLGYMNKYNIKMEMLWFGTNSGGHVQWLSRSKTDPVHLRVPDYVLYAPEFGAPNWSNRNEEGFTATTSEFNIRKEDMSSYSVDLEDTRLRDRERYVLGKVMEHIAQWDKAHQSKHPIIGVQIGNEVIGMHSPYDNSLINSYLSHVASVVKKSNYVVWTRVNCIFEDVYARVYENERLRNTPESTNLDFIGIDTYSHHFPSAEEFVSSMRTNIPYVGKNYRMIMETNSNRPYSAQMHLAALSGNNAFDYYDVSGLYGREGNGVKAIAAHIEDVRLVNKILTSAPTDIALNAHGYGLYVHNWMGNKSDITISNKGIGFEPSYPTSQGISIIRSKNEIIVMSTKGGTFTMPDTIQVLNAQKGYFNANDEWVEEGKIVQRNKAPYSIFVDAGTTIRLTCENTGLKNLKTYQAEHADLCIAADILSNVEGIGFAGNGYVKFPSTAGSYIQFDSIDGMNGGEKTIYVRYSHGGTKETRVIVFVNEKKIIIRLKPTGSWDNYQSISFKVSLDKGRNNKVKIETMGNTTRINRAVYHYSGANIDELQVEY